MGSSQSRTEKKLDRNFAAFDTDKSGGIDRAEVALWLQKQFPQLSIAFADVLIFLADKDGNGEIERCEFGEFYAALQVLAKQGGSTRELIWGAASAAQKSNLVPAWVLAGVLLKFGKVMSEEEAVKRYGKQLDRETFLRALESNEVQ